MHSLGYRHATAEEPLTTDWEAKALEIWRQIGNCPNEVVPWDKIGLIAKALEEAYQEGQCGVTVTIEEAKGAQPLAERVKGRKDGR